MARPAPVDGLRPGMPWRDAAAMIVATRARDVFMYAGRVHDTEDVEPVHDMRVATRRLRAALEAFGPAFPRKPFEQVLREVEQLADALGARRDPDVALAPIGALQAALPRADQAGLRSFEASLRTRQREGNDELAAVLARVGETRLERRLARLAKAARR